MLEACVPMAFPDFQRLEPKTLTKKLSESL